MRRGVGVALAAICLVGCSSVQWVQRDGCWVRHTQSFPNNVKEELGVCTRTPPQWSDDRVTRLVQECMVEADYRWKNEALDAWNRGQPLPPERPEQAVMQQCMNDAATSLVHENLALQGRITELTRDRDGLRARTDQDHQALSERQTELTQALGEAAKRAPPNAFALATSSGTASTQSDPKAPTPVVVAPAVVAPAVVSPSIVTPVVVSPSGHATGAPRQSNAPPPSATHPKPAAASHPKPAPKPPAVCVPPVQPAHETTAQRAVPSRPLAAPPAARPAVK